jgi:import inner membrane translocase subunit TIM23
MLVVSAVRSTGAFSGRLMPALAIASSTVATSSFSTSTASRSSSKVTCIPHPLFATKTAAPSPFLGFMSSRSASTAVPPSSSPSQSPTTQQLTWNRFLELRRTRRKISVAASSLSAVATTYTGLNVFISGGYDASLSATLGLDPIVTAGLSTVTLLAIGWLAGPFFGNAAFNARYRGIRGEIEAVRIAILSLLLDVMLTLPTERTRILLPYQSPPRGPHLVFHGESCPRLLRREDRQRSRLPALAERPASLQFEARRVPGK